MLSGSVANNLGDRMTTGHFLRATAIALPLMLASMAQADDHSAAPTEGQSPINIDEKAACGATLSPIALKYRRVSTVTVSNIETDGERAVKVNFTNPEGAGSLMLDGKEYKLKQFHLHTPSEHQIRGKAAPVEIHFVHEAADKTLAVVGQMAELDSKMRAGLRYGNGPLRTILQNLPADGKTSPEVTLLFSRNRGSDLFEVKDPRSFRYMGSLTTPPYSGGVHWIVLEEPVKLNAAQVAAIQGLFPAGKGNSRELQSLGDRKVQTDSVWRAGAACPAESMAPPS